MFASLCNRVSYLDSLFFKSICRDNDARMVSAGVRAISRTADGYLYPLVALVVLFGFPEQGPQFLLAGAAAYAVELPVYKILKNTIKRDRPFTVLSEIQNAVVPIDRFSFPSGHTAAAFIMATLLSHFFPLLAVPAFVWATCVAFSRIHLGVHYPTDTIAGVILGFTSAQAGLSLL